jgi:proteic killer suppression protein
MLQSFRCDDAKELFESGKSKRFASIKAGAERKLQMLDSAATLDFLRSPPGTRLEALAGRRKGTT